MMNKFCTTGGLSKCLSTETVSLFLQVVPSKRTYHYKCCKKLTELKTNYRTALQTASYQRHAHIFLVNHHIVLRNVTTRMLATSRYLSINSYSGETSSDEMQLPSDQFELNVRTVQTVSDSEGANNKELDLENHNNQFSTQVKIDSDSEYVLAENFQAFSLELPDSDVDIEEYRHDDRSITGKVLGIINDKLEEHQPSVNLSTFVNKSRSLKKLVDLGVDLSKVDSKGYSNMIVQLDFDTQIMPHIMFLHDSGVPGSEIGRIFSWAPELLQENLEDMNVRVNYLKSKKFSNDSIVTIVLRAPSVLSFSTKSIDRQLGYYQKMFELTGDELRRVITILPRLIHHNIMRIKESRYYLKKFLGFTVEEIKDVFLRSPDIFTLNYQRFQSVFELVHNTIGIPHEHILNWPQIFMYSCHTIEERHRFLISVNRVQYDPTKPNFISLQRLVEGSDAQFCETVAKTTEKHFDDFLKSI